MTRLPMLALLSFAAPFTLGGATATGAEDVRDAIEAGNRAFIAAFLRRDSQTVATLYTDDAKVIAPGSDVASGRAAIAAFWQKAIDTGVKDLALSTTAVEASGDLAYEDGMVKQVATNGQVTTGRYVVVWKRTKAGWKMHRDVWN